MMDKKNANGFSSKASESGSQRKQLPYSVETPYGFHLDLDFLKYVDDIEKGNTIKRVHIQRRNKGPKFSTLPRNFSLPGHGSRTAPKDSWASTSTLGPKPKSRVMEVQQIFEFRACESGSLGHPRVPGVIQKSTREDVGVRVFDEQPLGVHVRPHLLRASSMPVTVLQRKNSESVEDKGAQATGNSCKENGSSENVFATSEVADLHQQVATALQRIRELEEQVRTIPELQAEICSLREEKEQLLLKLKSQTPVLTEDSVEPTEQKDNEVQSSVNPEASVVVVTTSSMDQQELPSPVQDIQQSVTNQQEPEKQTDTEMPLEQQTEMAESPSAQEVAEGQPAENPSEPESVIEDVVTDTTAAGEPTHQEPEQSTSTQELVTQDKIAESSSAQESTQQEPTQSTSTQELLMQDKFEENSSAQESVEQEPTESPSTSKLVLQDQIVDNSSAEELTQQQTAQNTSEQALVMQNNIVEVSVEQESAQQELTQSPSTEDLAKQDKITEGSSAQEHTQKEPSLSPTTQETVMQDQIAENPSAQEPAEEEPAQCVATQESLKQDAAAESSSVQEFAEEQTTEVPIAQQSASQESEEPTTTQETVEQDKLSENTALEPAEKETKEGPTAQELMKQDDVSQGSSAQEFEEETTEPPTAQESVLQGAAESTVLKEEVRKEELGDDSSSPEAAEQKATESSTAQEVAVQDQMSENCLASESVFQEEAARSQKVEGAEEMQVWGIKEGHTGKEIDETDGDLDILSQQISSVSENLTIKMLQEKLMALEEKFSDANRELEKTNTLLREQMEENKLKEERIKQLTEEAEDFEKAEKAQVSQDTGALEETKQKETSDLALSCDVSVSTDLAPKTLSKGVSTDEELLLPDTAPIAGEQQKHLVHSGTQTDLTDAQEVSTDVVTVEQFQEVEITVHSQVVETALQKEFSTAIQEEPAGTAEEAEGSVAAADSQLTASDGADEAGPSAELQQPSQSDQDQEPERQGLSEPATSNVAIGQYVNKIHGLLNEQWACLGSGHTEIATTLKQPASKFSSIQTQLVSSLNALSAFYSSPGQKGGASRQAGLKSIMKKNDPADKQGNGGAKKNLKFVGVNGGYETTSSEESSGEDNADEDNAEEDSSEPEVEEKDEGPGVGAGAATEDVAEEPMPEGAEAAAPLPEGDTVPPDTMDPDASASPQEEQPGREPVHEGFMAACHYIKDRQAEVATPDKEMREFLTVLYQEWFRVSSQKDSLVDTVTLYLKEVGAATPTLLRFIVNLADGNGNSALHYSVSHSNFPIVKLLLDTGLCEVDNQNKAGYTAVMLASLTAADGPEDMEVALQLLRQGNVNARASQAGQTALMLAVSHGRSAMVRLLLTCEADVNMQDHDGSTALMCACEHGHTDIARLLLERDDCDLSLTDREGHDALAVAAQASHSEMIDLLKAHTGDGASAAPKPL